MTPKLRASPEHCGYGLSLFLAPKETKPRKMTWEARSERGDERDALWYRAGECQPELAPAGPEKQGVHMNPQSAYSSATLSLGCV